MLRNQISNTLVNEGEILKNSEIINSKEVAKLKDEEAADYMREIFNLWFEQKMVRAACKDQIETAIVERCDHECTKLDDSIICQHEVLSHEEAIEIMGVDPAWHNYPGDLRFKDVKGVITDVARQNILRHYIQKQIAIFDDPYIQIRKVVDQVQSKLDAYIKLGKQKDAIFVAIRGANNADRKKLCESFQKVMQDKLGAKSHIIQKSADGIFAKKELPIIKKIPDAKNDDDALVEIWLVWSGTIIVKGREKALISSDDEGVDMSSSSSANNLIQVNLENLQIQPSISMTKEFLGVLQKVAKFEGYQLQLTPQ